MMSSIEKFDDHWERISNNATKLLCCLIEQIAKSDTTIHEFISGFEDASIMAADIAFKMDTRVLEWLLKQEEEGKCDV